MLESDSIMELCEAMFLIQCNYAGLLLRIGLISIIMIPMIFKKLFNECISRFKRLYKQGNNFDVNVDCGFYGSCSSFGFGLYCVVVFKVWRFQALYCIIAGICFFVDVVNEYLNSRLVHILTFFDFDMASQCF